MRKLKELYIMKEPKTTRKPGDLWLDTHSYPSCALGLYKEGKETKRVDVDIEAHTASAEDCRRIASWLARAADWMDKELAKRQRVR